MTLMWPDVNDLDEDQRRAVDVIAPARRNPASTARRWAIVLVIAFALAAAWDSGAIRPALETNAGAGAGMSYANETGVLVVDVVVRNAGVAPVRITDANVPAWGSVTDVAIEGHGPLPITIGGGESATFVVTVQSPPPPCNLPAEAPMILRANVKWLPFDRDVVVALPFTMLDSLSQDWCTGTTPAA